MIDSRSAAGLQVTRAGAGVGVRVAIGVRWPGRGAAGQVGVAAAPAAPRARIIRTGPTIRRPLRIVTLPRSGHFLRSSGSVSESSRL